MGYAMESQRAPVHPRLALMVCVLAGVLAANAASVRSAHAPLCGGLCVVERRLAACAELPRAARYRIVHGAGTVSLRRAPDRTTRVELHLQATAGDPRTAAARAHAAEISLSANGVITPRVLPAGVLIDLDVALPDGVDAEVETIAGRTIAEGVGPLTVRSQAGDIWLTAPAGPFDLETGGGDVRVTLLAGSRAGRVRTLTGSIAVRARLHAMHGRSPVTSPTRIEAHSQRGRCTIADGFDYGPLLSLEAISGDVDAQEI